MAAWKACSTLLLLALGCHAETGQNAWLRYQPKSAEVPAVVSVLNHRDLTLTAQHELVSGLKSMTQGRQSNLSWLQLIHIAISVLARAALIHLHLRVPHWPWRRIKRRDQ